MKFGKIVAVALLVIAVVGVAVGWLLTSKSNIPKVPASNDLAQASQTTMPTPAVNPPADQRTHINRPIRTNSATTTIPSAVATAQPKTNGIPDWEERVENILTSEIPDNQKAKKMLEMFPLLSPEAQEKVAHNLSNLTPDDEYAPLGNYLTNSALPDAVLDVLFEDVFNRPNSVKLPLLLTVARDPQNPKASEAKDVLELFLEDDYGSDWGKWQARMDQWLKDNPD